MSKSTLIDLLKNITFEQVDNAFPCFSENAKNAVLYLTQNCDKPIINYTVVKITRTKDTVLAQIPLKLNNEDVEVVCVNSLFATLYEELKLDNFGFLLAKNNGYSTRISTIGGVMLGIFKAIYPEKTEQFYQTSFESLPISQQIKNYFL